MRPPKVAAAIAVLAVASRGVFKSVKDPSRKLMRYIRHYNKNPKPIKWKYSNPARRITASDSIVTAH